MQRLLAAIALRLEIRSVGKDVREHAQLLVHCWNDGFEAGRAEGERLARTAPR